MATNPESPHLSNTHRDTLVKIFEHPMSYNIEWREVISLLVSLGTVEQRKEGKVKVTLGSESQFLERPRGKDVDADEVVALRKLLSEGGYAPTK